MIAMLKEERDDLAQKYTGQIALNIKSNDLDKISKIDSVKRNGHTYTVNCSAEKSEDGEKISKDNITVRLELKKENQLIKYQVLEIK